jgi:hypothetical protein
MQQGVSWLWLFFMQHFIPFKKLKGRPAVAGVDNVQELDWQKMSTKFS